MVAVETAELLEGGLAGDHARPGKRALTLFQHEHLAAVGAYLGRGPVAPEALRRNVGVAGVNLCALRGTRLRIGDAIVEITGPCAPCSRMEEALGRGGYNALRGHGGWCARVVAAGWIRRGDRVVRA